MNQNREEANVGARKKLNSAAILGVLILASTIGFFTGSWLTFMIAALILLGLNYYSGDIRGSKRGDW